MPQVDHSSYKGQKNGIRRFSEVFHGEDYYGKVKLPYIYQSEIARKRSAVKQQKATISIEIVASSICFPIKCGSRSGAHVLLHSG
ncbi:hypothetical protein MK805_05735 [Shimazuella sp. AN120528]|uniref:hypothetical protein n=1 Tax=Shimazuella soli TaxID=1892854 RepID=UPI001F0F499C|nr:hypothetical protein [Shimazuella soli]MCH5584468.1 hypothetical protein [Shimazuella soli]